MKIATKVAALSSAVSATLILSTTSAFAAGTYIQVGSSTSGTHAVSATNAGSIEFESDFGVPTWCTGSTIAGEIYAGVEVTVGNVIGKVTALTLTGCTMTNLSLPLAIGKEPGAWPIVVASEPSSANAPISVVVTQVSAYVRSPSTPPWTCEYGVTGTLPGRFAPSTGTLAVNTSPNFPLAITAYSGAGTRTPSTVTCGGQIYTGDKLSMVGTFPITSPNGPITHN